MIIRYEVLQNKPYVMRALTGLSPAEFDALLKCFEQTWNDFAYEHFICGRQRQRAYGGGRKPALKEPADKLLFILFYFRLYPTQEAQGFFFGLSQEQANAWIHRLTPLLSKALGYDAQLPERQASRLEALLQAQPVLEFFLDGTERPRRRPKDNELQKQFYSGKKKRHTVKNNVITDRDGRVLYLSGTFEGKKADKAIADEEGYGFPPGSTVYQDKGFQGHAPPGVQVKQPKKKPRGGELSEQEKASNQEINRERVRVEHAIGGVKVFRIVSDVFRNWKQGYDDAVMEIACGLNNVRRRPSPRQLVST